MRHTYGELPENEQYFYNPYQALGVNAELQQTVREHIAAAEQAQQVGLSLMFALEPGVTNLTLPFIVERYDGLHAEYTSTFDRLIIGSTGVASKRRFFDIALVSTDPRCQNPHCFGCQGCRAPGFLFDTDANISRGRQQDAYIFLENQLKLEHHEPMTLLTHYWSVGELQGRGFDDPKTRTSNTGHIFKTVVNTVFAQLSDQSFMLVHEETN